MRVVTWLDKLTDESNTWFAALRAEAEGDFVSAIVLYLRDATESLRQGSLVRAGLSCSCAADCLVKTGDPGRSRNLYHEAGSVYRENFERAINVSVREALWSLERAYECYLLADDSDGAQQVREIYKPLTHRAYPFREQELLQLPRPEPPSSNKTNSGAESRPSDVELRKAIHEFLQSRVSSKEPGVSPKPRRGAQGGQIDEEDIVNQLG